MRECCRERKLCAGPQVRIRLSQGKHLAHLGGESLFGMTRGRPSGRGCGAVPGFDNGFKGQGYAGATVFRAIMGFGASAHLRTDRIEVLSLDLPIVVEVVETEERIQAILPEIDAMMGGGLITLEQVRVLVYRPQPG